PKSKINHALWLDQKLIDRRLCVGLPGLEDRRRKIRMIRRIWVVLRFQTERPVLLVPAVLGITIEKVAGVKLHPRLSCVNLHHAPVLGFSRPSREAQFARLLAQHVAMVVSCWIRGSFL